MRTLFLTTLLIFALWAVAAGQTAGVADSVGRAVTRTWYDQPVDPDRYLIRPGEQLEVVFVNTRLSNLYLTVNSEGRIVDRSLGVLDMRGLTLTQARQRLMEALPKQYNVPEIVISLMATYRVSIQVTGAVKHPGCYVGYTSHRVSDIIDSAGGISSDGSSRRIVLSGGPTPITVDLDRARYMGDRAADPCLYAGDHVYVPSRTAAPVAVLGGVNAPREIELLDNETIDTLIALAGGYNGPTDAPPTATVLNAPARDPRVAGALKPGDRVVIGQPTDERVVITGNVKSPGGIAVSSTVSLGDALQAAGGLADNANAGRIAVFRRTLPEGQLVAGLTRFPLYLPPQGAQAVMLRPGDSVVVPSRVGFVLVSGPVSRPGVYPYLENSPVSYYLRLAGGMEQGAEISVFDRVTGLTLAGSANTVVLDGDAIVITRAEDGLR